MVASVLKLCPPAGADPVWHPLTAQLPCATDLTALNKGPAVPPPGPPPVPPVLVPPLSLLHEKRRRKQNTDAPKGKNFRFIPAV